VGEVRLARWWRTTVTCPPTKDSQRAGAISGRLDLLDVEIGDIAHGLARVARWNGQTAGAHAYSVAQHTLLVEEIAAQTAPEIGATGRLAVMLHDAPEYVIGDLISPFKVLLSGDYKAVERRLLAAIHLRFGLPAAAES
jgi:5'-deoxynucleotidase YfbR-like HD superfamily hydrolase